MQRGVCLHVCPRGDGAKDGYPRLRRGNFCACLRRGEFAAVCATARLICTASIIDISNIIHRAGIIKCASVVCFAIADVRSGFERRRWSRAINGGPG